MHTGTRIGVSVGLRARKCMHLRMHTDCIQNAYKWARTHKKSKKRRIPLLLLLYTACFYTFYCPFFRQSFYCSRLQAFLNESWTTFTACFRRRWAFRAFIAHLTDCPPSSRPIFLTYGHHAFLRACTQSVRSVARMNDRKAVFIVCIKKPTMRSMREHNSGIDCIQCIQKRE